MLSRWQVLIPFSVLLVVFPSASGWISKDINCTAGVPQGKTPQHKGNASIILDEVLGAVSEYLRNINNTQIDIPDQESDFTFFLLTGNLSLSEGKVSGFDRIKRFGDAAMEYFDKSTTGSAAVKFADASFFYRIKFRISNSVLQGTIRASLEQLSMRINMSVNLTSLCQKIDSVKVENLSSIKVQTDIDVWIPKSLTNTLVNTVTWIYMNRLVPFIEERTAKAIQGFLDSLDLEELLRPSAALMKVLGETSGIVNDIP